LNPTDDKDEAVAQLLRNASTPTELDPARNLQLIEQAFDSLESPAAAELKDADELRLALENTKPHPLLEVAELLRAAARPETFELNAFRTRGLVAEALKGDLPRKPKLRTGGWVLVFSGLAAAAGLALVVGRQESIPAARLLHSEHSTVPLLRAPLAVEDTTLRIDRIAELRTSDLRNNRYAQWGLE